jgi:hypothetical protein
MAADSYTTSLRLQMQGTGNNLNTWGAIADAQYQLIEAAITGDNGYAGGTGTGISIDGLTSYALTVAQGAADQARHALYPFTGTLSAPCTVTIPAVVRIGWATNATSGNNNVILQASANGGHLTLPPGGGWTLFYCDGVNVTAPAIGTPVSDAMLPVISCSTIQAALQALGISIAANELDAGGAGAGFGQIRLMAGDYGVIWRSDGANLYLLLTAKGQQTGDWNSLRPIIVDVATGALTFDGSAAGSTFLGPVNVNGPLTAQGGGSFASSLGTSGSQQLPGGKVERWGQGNTSNGTSSVTFATPFPTTCDNVQLTINGGNGPLTINALIRGTATATGFTVYSAPGTNVGFDYYAIGH